MFYSVPTTNRAALCESPRQQGKRKERKGRKKGPKKTQSCSARRLPEPFRCYDNPPLPQRKERQQDTVSGSVRLQKTRSLFLPVGFSRSEGLGKGIGAS